ncbi:transmembrane protein 33 isoform 2-T2 [Thomomys bottae]
MPVGTTYVCPQLHGYERSTSGSAIPGSRRCWSVLLGLVRKLRPRSGLSGTRSWISAVRDSVSSARVFPMADATPNGPQGAGAVQFMMTNKLDTAMWLSRLFTVYCSALFVLPLLGFHEAASFYQRALLANALTSALRLHQRLPHFQLSRAFLAQALLEDSCHYLLYSLIFVNSSPVTMSIFPVLLFSLLHAATYTKKVLDAKGSNSLPLLRSLLDKLSANQQNILKFIACNEIFLMPATVFMLFSGQGSLLQPFIYYRFLTLRYSSRRNPYCRNLFNELRIVVEHIIMKPACPLFVRRLCLQSIAFISRLAPTA